MAKPNYSFEKRQRELAKQKKKSQKEAEKASRKRAGQAERAPDDDAGGPGNHATPPVETGSR